MKKTRLGAFILWWSVCSSVAYAQTTLVIPDMKSDKDNFIKIDLPAPTSVKSSYVSMVVQKGWSISSVGPNEKFKASVTATSTSDVTNDPT